MGRYFCVKSINIYFKRNSCKLLLRLVVFLQFVRKAHTRYKRLERVCLAAFRFYLAVSYITVRGHYKSTILDAIKTVLNQQYRNVDKSVLRDLFNTQIVATFQDNPSVKMLHRILIEVELALDPRQKNADYFYGEVYGKRKKQDERFGMPKLR